MLKKIKRTISSIILCIRFPFLYPRNRFTNRHYNNWKISGWLKDLHQKYFVCKHSYNFEDNPKKKYFFKQIGRFGTCWTSIWAYYAYHIVKWYHDNILQLFHCIPTYTELDLMPTGWRKAFGIEMCEDIKKILLKKGGRQLLHAYRIMDIKEKYGELRWDSNWTFDELEKVIGKYVDKSVVTCIECGAKAVWMTDYRDWASPYCDKCIPEYAKERAEAIS